MNKYSFKFSRAEKAAFSFPEWKKPSEWMPQNIPVLDGEFIGQKIRLDKMPHTIGIMDAAVYPCCRMMTVDAVAQTGKTTLINAIMAWRSVFDAGRSLSIFPNEISAKENFENRLKKLYQQSPGLRKIVTGNSRHLSASVLRLATQDWHAGWAGSVMSLADRSIKHLDLQEVEKYGESPNSKESGTFELAKLRTRAFPTTHTITVSSSPTTAESLLWRLLSKETQAVFVFWVKCVDCGAFQYMDVKNIDWPHDDDGHSIDGAEIAAKKLARYICTNCGSVWDDDKRNEAAQGGKWFQIGDVNKRVSEQEKGRELFDIMDNVKPASIGFIIPSNISYFVSFSEIAQDYLRQFDKKLSSVERFVAYKDFQNKHEARPWVVQQSSQPVSKILKFRDERKMGELPPVEQIAGIFSACDTQGDGHNSATGFPYAVIAFGWGARERWLIDCGEVKTFEEVACLFFETKYSDLEGNELGSNYSVIDSGGHRTREVYAFCGQYRDYVHPYNGSTNIKTPYSFGAKEFIPGTKQRLPAGAIQLFNVNPNLYKDSISMMLSSSTRAESRYFFPSDFSKESAKQLLAESRDERGKWKLIGNRANHLLDCFVMAEALADWGGVVTWEPDEEDEPEIQPQKSAVKVSF